MCEKKGMAGWPGYRIHIIVLTMFFATCGSKQLPVSHCLATKVNYFPTMIYSVGPHVHVPPFKRLIEHLTIISLRLRFTWFHIQHEESNQGHTDAHRQSKYCRK